MATRWIRTTAIFCVSLIVLASGRGLIPGACQTLASAAEADGTACCRLEAAAACQPEAADPVIERVHSPVRCGLCELAHALTEPLSLYAEHHSVLAASPAAPLPAETPFVAEIPIPAAPRDPPPFA